MDSDVIIAGCLLHKIQRVTRIGSMTDGEEAAHEDEFVEGEEQPADSHGEQQRHSLSLPEVVNDCKWISYAVFPSLVSIPPSEHQRKSVHDRNDCYDPEDHRETTGLPASICTDELSNRQ
jgi:hypothetical protein